MEKKSISKEMRDALRADFPEEAYSAHPSKTFLTTLKAMFVTERLNDVFGIGRWTVHHEVVLTTNDYVLVSGTFESLDYDVHIPTQYGGHQTTGKNTEIADGYKSAITDCISKIASYLEVGIRMFKGEINPPNKGNSESKYKFGSAKDDKLPWIKDGQVTAMIKTIPNDKQQVIDKLSAYKWSRANKDLITKALDESEVKA